MCQLSRRPRGITRRPKQHRHPRSAVTPHEVGLRPLGGEMRFRRQGLPAVALKVRSRAIDHQPTQATASPAPGPLTDRCPEPPLEKLRMCLDRTSCPMATARPPVVGGDWQQPPPLLSVSPANRRNAQPRCQTLDLQAPRDSLQALRQAHLPPRVKRTYFDALRSAKRPQHPQVKIFWPPLAHPPL